MEIVANANHQLKNLTRKLLSFFKLDQMYLLRGGKGEVQYQQNANFLHSTSRFAIAVEPDCGRSLDNRQVL